MENHRCQIEYLPPAEADIHACAERVCQRLAHRRGEAFTDPEVVHGLAEFMRIAARIQVKHLNRSSELVDRSADQGYFGGSDEADG